MNVIETHDLTKIFTSGQIALNRVDLTVAKGTAFGLIGPNGAGKSTTLRILVGLMRLTGGTVNVFGERMSMSAARLRRRIGFLPQTGSLPPDMTPLSYLELIGKLFGVPTQTRKPRLSGLLHAVELLSEASKPIHSLSTGMLTRLGIAASMINDPDLLLWDEPTLGLDPTGRKYTLDLIRDLKREKTIILSTHILPDADQVCDAVGVLNHGRLIFSGSITEMKRLIHRSSVDMSIVGDIPALLTALDVEEEGLHTERLSEDMIRVGFEDGHDFSSDLSRVLEVVTRHGAEIVSIRTAGEIEDAFLQRLEEDRLRGFVRARDGHPEDRKGPRNASLPGAPPG